MSDGEIGNDELISQFMAFTGSTDASKAASYLEMSGNNVETAVGLYMEHEQPGGGGGAGFGGVTGGGAPMMGGEDDIRAPDATRTMRLMDDPMGHPPDDTYRMMNALMDEQITQSAFAAPHVDARAAVNAAVAASGSGDAAGDDEDNENDEYAYDEDEDDEMNDAAPSGVNPTGLADMFAPPSHLIHNAGGFAGARQMAKDSKRWLLVNIQRDAEFASHALNRDVWRDELVENLIREGFIFWQQFDAHAEGRTYCERYKVYEFPHIGIIDPRTGRLLLKKEGWDQQHAMTAETFAEIAMDFCSHHSFDRPPQAPRPAGAPTAVTARPAKRPMHEMSEDEQLQAAMRASLEDVTAVGEGSATPGDDDDVEIVDVTSENNDSKQPAEEESPPPANGELLNMTVPDEPAGGARVQLRMPDGKRVVRKFAGSDTVKTIYAFFAQSSDDAKGGKEFVLKAGFPPKDLIDCIDDTIDDTKLSGQAITILWK